MISHIRGDLEMARLSPNTRVAEHPVIVELITERQFRGWTLKKVARVTGFSHCTLGRYEGGITSPRLEDLTAWAAILGYRLTLERVRPRRMSVQDHR